MKYFNTKKIPCLFIVLFLLSLFGSSLGAQRFLQMEKVNSLKNWRFYPGDELVFRVDSLWYIRTITGFNFENKWILFEDGKVGLEEINTIKTYTNPKLGRTLGQQLYLFGTAWGLYSAVDALATDRSLNSDVLYVMGASYLTGFILSKLPKGKKHRIGNNRRIRLLDLTFYPTD